MRIFFQEAGVISRGDLWVCIHENWMYVAETPMQLIEILNKEWEDDKHLYL
jgi:hypothetical protein